MILWIVSATGAVFALSDFFSGGGFAVPRFEREVRSVIQARDLFHELEETLGSGSLPTPSRWQALENLAEPWCALAVTSIKILRTQGCPLIPTLKRLRELTHLHQQSLLDAKTKTVQAVIQATTCLILVPSLGTLLYFLLPGISARSGVWMTLCGVAFLLAAAAAGWLLRMSDSARWGGLRTEDRSCLLSAQCFGERLIAYLRSGSTPDLAWQSAVAPVESSLLLAWGGSVWTSSDEPPTAVASALPKPLFELGFALKLALQHSLMEGRPSVERVESILNSFRVEWNAKVSQEIQLLGTRALKPLFLGVAPSIIGLLMGGMILCWLEAAPDIL